MSTAAKLTLATSILITGSIVGYVHLSQKNEREVSMQIDVISMQLNLLAFVLVFGRPKLQHQC